ncbi:VUT family protein [Streptomyces hundungensis]|uniref:VUT family protein n=1 Tax=Streptomyces hundungensis TaxID=1077946 RepID=UPI0034116D5F
MAARSAAALLTAGYVAALVTANLATSYFGLVPVGFGQTATAGTFAAGIALMVRNLVQDHLGRFGVIVAVLFGSLLSALTSATSLALASGAAVLISELADMAVYTPLRRAGWVRAVVPATLLGALLDSVVFLSLAGLAVWPHVPGQLVGKTWAIIVPVAVVLTVRCVKDRRGVPASVG